MESSMIIRVLMRFRRIYSFCGFRGAPILLYAAGAKIRRSGAAGINFTLRIEIIFIQFLIHGQLVRPGN